MIRDGMIQVWPARLSRRLPPTERRADREKDAAMTSPSLAYRQGFDLGPPLAAAAQGASPKDLVPKDITSRDIPS